jgi:hypothetical protein
LKQFIKVIRNQSLVDIAVQYYGSVSGVFLLLEDNKELMSINDKLLPGQKIFVRDALQPKIVNYLKNPVATLDESSTADGIGYMTVETNFFVGEKWHEK